MEYKFSVSKVDECRIIIEAGCFANLGPLLKETNLTKTDIYITDKNVHKLYGYFLDTALLREGLAISSLVLESGEETKSIVNTEKLIDYLIAREVQRRSILMAFGGGVITDLVGFVASIYMRGVKYVNVPTTLVSQLDAAVGGKTAINFPVTKNIVGSFYQPSLVVIDPELLRTLPEVEIRQGLAEAVKVALISSEELFAYIESHIDKALNKDIHVLEHIIRNSVQIKLSLLEPDPYERDLRRLLNFGHMIGHALESAMGYSRIKHGDAIAIGMMAEARLALHLKVCNNETVERLKSILLKIGLPISCNQMILPKLSQTLSHIALIRGGSLNAVLPLYIGSAKVDGNVSASDILKLVLT
jgi:3-dehydroquinate synthase